MPRSSPRVEEIPGRIFSQHRPDSDLAGARVETEDFQQVLIGITGPAHSGNLTALLEPDGLSVRRVEAARDQRHRSAAPLASSADSTRQYSIRCAADPNAE